MNIERGMRTVRCVECGVEGKISVGTQRSSGRVKVEDYIDHGQECSRRKKEQPRHLRKKEWRGQEKHANALVGAYETPASGAVGEDGDGRAWHEWRVESKQTKSGRYLLRQDTWTKLVGGALRAGEEPLLHLEFIGNNGWKDRYVVIRRELFDAYGPNEPYTAAWNRNPKSYRLSNGDRTPLIVTLVPEGVMLDESTFKTLKEQYERRTRSL